MDFTDDGKDDNWQYREGLFANLLVAVICLAIGGKFSNWWEEFTFFSGLMNLAGVFGIGIWVWGTLALGFFEILEFNVYWILNMTIFLCALGIHIFTDDDDIMVNYDARNYSNYSPNQISNPGREEHSSDRLDWEMEQILYPNIPKSQNLYEINRFGLKVREKKPKPSQGEERNQDTELLVQGVANKESTKKYIETSDSNGIITKTTSFSVVTINHIANRVEKVPSNNKHNQMFIDEINVMKSLEDKGIDVGLLDYELGDSPKIVTRYFGSHKLGDTVLTASNKGKKNLVVQLIEEVGHIHKAGWVHRDLKPDNILVSEGRNGNHRFAAIIDYGIAMKINRKQMETHNTAGTKFFGHPSQKEPNFNASTGQDWFSLARIFALILRGVSVESLDAEIQSSQRGLDLRTEIQELGFKDKVVDSITEMILQATQPSCDDNETIETLARIGKELGKVW